MNDMNFEGDFIEFFENNYELRYGRDIVDAAYFRSEYIRYILSTKTIRFVYY